jgi:restriction system protein
MSMRPDAFEQLARRLLREADFASVNVTGRSGHGGIDGPGDYRLGLVSFPVFFQCKRYQGSVPSSAVSSPSRSMLGSSARCRCVGFYALYMVVSGAFMKKG